MTFIQRYFFIGNLLLLSLSLGAIQVQAQASDILPDRQQIIAKSILANDYWIGTNGGETNPAEDRRWDPAAYYTGNQRLIEVLREELATEAAKKSVYLNRAVLWGVKHGWRRGQEGLTHADAHCAGQTYIDLNRIDSQSVRLQGSDNTTGILPTMQSVYDQGINSNTHWWWIDAFYMAGPVFARLDQDIGDASGRDYSDALKAWYLDMRDTKALRHSTTDAYEGLWYRDADSKTTFTENGEPEFWGRGNGWVIAGLARVMDELGPSHPDWSLYRDDLIAMAEALVPLQQADGLWRASLADPTDSRWPNPEASATAFFAYAIAWGINNGVLDSATYLPVVAKAWNGMLTEAQHISGKIGYIQAAGRAPDVATYDHTEDYGVGAFLLAGAELSLLAFEPAIHPDAGPNQSIQDFDMDGQAQATLDGSGTIEGDGVEASYTWLEDGIAFATGSIVQITLPLGAHSFMLRVTDNEGNDYEDSTTVTVQALTPEVTASDYQDPNVPANTLDSDLNTRWSAEGTHWIQYDLRMPVLVHDLSMAFYLGDQRNSIFSIELSLDGSSWTEVFDGQSNGSTLQLENFDFTDTVARYVRINGTGNTNSLWNSYTEVVIHWSLSNYDGNSNALPDAWEEIYLDGPVANTGTDHDGDGRDASEEWLWGSNPTASDHLADLAIEPDGEGGRQLRFQGKVAVGVGYAGLTRSYTVESSTTLAPDSWTPVEGYIDIPASSANPMTLPMGNVEKRFYRIQVSLE